MTSLLIGGTVLWVLGSWASAITWWCYCELDAIRSRFCRSLTRGIALTVCLTFALVAGFGFGAIVVALGEAANDNPGGLWWWTRALIGAAVVVACVLYATIRRHEGARR